MFEVAFGELLSEPLRNGVSYPSRSRGQGVRMVNMRELFANDHITPEVECERVPLTTSEKTSSILQWGDLLFARQSLTYEGAGKVSLVVDESGPTWDSHLIRARVKPTRADSSYLYYFFRSAEGRRRMKTIVQQVAAAGIRGSDLARLTVPSPPLSEQRAIAEVLGALTDKIAANTALAERAEALGSVVYDSMSAFWPRVPMSSVLNAILGGTPPRARDDYWTDGDQLWISARDITSASNKVVIDTAEKITRGAVAGTKAKALPSGSVILTARGTVGEVGRLARPASFNQSCYGFRPDVVPPGLLYFSILRATQRAKAVAHGSVFDTITKTTFEHLDLAWNEGQAAAAEDAVSPILDVVSAAVSENRALAALRDALLPQLMSGKIRVRDAEAAASEAGA